MFVIPLLLHVLLDSFSENQNFYDDTFGRNYKYYYKNVNTLLEILGENAETFSQAAKCNNTYGVRFGLA